jgi:hypothetical protein
MIDERLPRLPKFFFPLGDALSAFGSNRRPANYILALCSLLSPHKPARKLVSSKPLILLKVGFQTVPVVAHWNPKNSADLKTLTRPELSA